MVHCVHPPIKATMRVKQTTLIQVQRIKFHPLLDIFYSCNCPCILKYVCSLFTGYHCNKSQLKLCLLYLLAFSLKFEYTSNFNFFPVCKDANHNYAPNRNNQTNYTCRCDRSRRSHHS